MIKVNPRTLVIKRAKALISQEKLAIKAGIGRATIARIENNSSKKQSPLVIGKLAKALNVSVEELIKE